MVGHLFLKTFLRDVAHLVFNSIRKDMYTNQVGVGHNYTGSRLFTDLQWLQYDSYCTDQVGDLLSESAVFSVYGCMPPAGQVYNSAGSDVACLVEF